MIPTCKKLYLCNQSLEPLCVINGLRTETVDLHIRIKDYSTLSFEVDKYINIDGISRAMVQNLIDEGKITVNGKTVKNNYKIKYLNFMLI